jgi:hypothetical protein
MKTSGPLAFLVEDIKRMEVSILPIEDAIRGDKKDAFGQKRPPDALAIPTTRCPRHPSKHITCSFVGKKWILLSTY